MPLPAHAVTATDQGPRSDVSGIRRTDLPYTTMPATAYAPVDLVPPPSDAFPDEASRYEAGELLGEGGMGEVRLCKDKRIGREVAFKAIRPSRIGERDLRRRFVREARVQGQLEHPSIVPVYDLVVRPAGAFFTMKRVRGATLEDVIARMRAGDADYRARFSRRKLLTAFCNVCLTVDYAHSRGVFHRDLKPANVMLGDFGEVYVLDWGVAKIVDGASPASAREVDRLDETSDLPPSSRSDTAAGTIMGTLGYMAPEQLLEGKADARSDVYALGAILFEILLGAPLHAGSTTLDIVDSTSRPDTAALSRRMRDADVPPELESTCAKATAREPPARYASARELHDAVERFLDGDRDIEQRRAMAAEHAEEAGRAADRAQMAGPTAGDAERLQAFRAVGRALALDASNELALRTVLRLRLERPLELPGEVKNQLKQARLGVARQAGRLGATLYALGLLFVPLFLWMGVRDWPLFTLAISSFVAGGVLAMVKRARTWPNHLVVVAALTSIAFAILTRAFGPWMVVPAIVATNTAALAVDVSRVRRWMALAMGCMAVLVPQGLEWAGIIEPSYVFTNGTFALVPHLLDLPRVPTVVTLAVTMLVAIVVPSVFLGHVRRAVDLVQRRLVLQGWQLRQLVPDEAQPSTHAPPTAR